MKIFFKNDKSLNYGRYVISMFAKEAGIGKSAINVLDIAAGHGDDLENIRKVLVGGPKINLFAIEGYESNINEMKSKGIEVSNINIERDNFPYEDGSMDICCANQILEHVKELPWIVSEVSRILKTGGYFIIGVPNLASFHNRILLLCGKQPTSIKTLGPHVRGYTCNGLKQFIETDGYFEVESVKGSNFYPFPRWIAVPLSKIFSKASVSVFLKAKRTDKEGKFISIFDTRFFETNFYIGNGKTTFEK